MDFYIFMYVPTSRLVLIFTHTWKKRLFSKNFRTRFGNVSYRFVRILALKQGHDTSVKYFCHFQDGEVVIEANYHEIWVSAWHPHPPEGNLLEGIDNTDENILENPTGFPALGVQNYLKLAI